MSFGPEGYKLGTDEGDSMWFFNTLTTVKAGSDDTHGAFTLMRIPPPARIRPPAAYPPPRGRGVLRARR